MRNYCIAILLALTAFATAQESKFVGTYEAVSIIHSKAVDNKTLPPGQVMWMELHAGGHWDMRNKLVGFDGTWSIRGKRLILLTTFGPSGKVNPPQKSVLRPSPNRSRLVLEYPKKDLFGQVEFRYAPNIKADLQRRLQAATR